MHKEGVYIVLAKEFKIHQKLNLKNKKHTHAKRTRHMLCARDMTSIKISGKGHNSLGGVWVGDVLGVKFGTRNLLRVNPAGLILRVEVGGGGGFNLAWLGLARHGK